MKMDNVLQALDYVVHDFKHTQERDFMLYIIINGKPCIILNDVDIQTFIDSFYMSNYLAKKSCYLSVYDYANIEQLIIDIEVTI